jgi:plasmid stabilization system protein ParE
MRFQSAPEVRWALRRDADVNRVRFGISFIRNLSVILGRSKINRRRAETWIDVIRVLHDARDLARHLPEQA